MNIFTIKENFTSNKICYFDYVLIQFNLKEEGLIAVSLVNKFNKSPKILINKEIDVKTDGLNTIILPLYRFIPIEKENTFAIYKNTEIEIGASVELEITKCDIVSDRFYEKFI